MDIMEGARVPGQKDRRAARARQIAEPTAPWLARAQSLTPGQLAKEIAQLEERMFQHARDLEFEEAARLRDRSEEHTSEIQSRGHIVCRLLLEQKKQDKKQKPICNYDYDNYLYEQGSDG